MSDKSDGLPPLCPALVSGSEKADSFPFIGVEGPMRKDDELPVPEPKTDRMPPASPAPAPAPAVPAPNPKEAPVPKPARRKWWKFFWR
jgi:hypothetical protein